MTKPPMMMGPQFFSLHMLITSRGWSDHPTLTLMDLLADAIADEEKALLSPVANLLARQEERP